MASAMSMGPIVGYSVTFLGMELAHLILISIITSTPHTGLNTL